MIQIIPLTGVPQVHQGDDVASLLWKSLQHNGIGLLDGDVIVISSKIASKALGLTSNVQDKDALVRQESDFVVAERAMSNGRITRVVKAKAGPVMAAAGIDASNTGSEARYLLLPHDPDAVAADLHHELATRAGHLAFGVILSDTSGRPWRLGVSDFVLGAHGVQLIEDLRGGVDSDGRVMEVTTRAIGDELAAAADLAKGKVEAIPAAVVRGVRHAVLTAGSADGSSEVAQGRDLVRSGRDDWFSYGRAEAVRAALGIEAGSAASDRVGIALASAHEPVRRRLSRAVALALCGEEGAAADVSDDEVVLTAADPYVLGRVTARLEAALWVESMRSVAHDVAIGATQCRARLRITDHAGAATLSV